MPLIRETNPLLGIDIIKWIPFPLSFSS
jgi:hypothetical protein